MRDDGEVAEIRARQWAWEEEDEFGRDGASRMVVPGS